MNVSLERAQPLDEGLPEGVLWLDLRPALCDVAYHVFAPFSGGQDSEVIRINIGGGKHGGTDPMAMEKRGQRGTEQGDGELRI